MDDSDGDKAAIMEVLKAETEAYMRRDFPALARHWVHSPQARLMTGFVSLGTRVVEGWDAIGARLQSIMERLPHKHDIARLRREKVNIVVGGDMAWVSYDQIGSDTGDIHRHRGFYIIDRTEAVGFKPGEDLNVENMIRVRRRID